MVSDKDEDVVAPCHRSLGIVGICACGLIDFIIQDKHPDYVICARAQFIKSSVRIPKRRKQTEIRCFKGLALSIADMETVRED